MTDQLKKAQKVSQSIIANKVALFYNEEIRFTKYYKGNLKKFGKPFINQLLIAEKNEYDVLFEKDNIDEIACNVENAYMEAIKEFTGFYIHGYGEVAYVLKALKEDPKSIIGISKKVLNNKK